MRIEEAIGAGYQGEVKVGMKCTEHCYSDAHACQVTWVSKSGKSMRIRHNTYHVEGEGGIGHQDWVLHENEFEGPEIECTKRKNGQWRTKGKYGNYIAIGQWHKYYDWSF